ncbi:hypothetical protein BJX64DRAFT_287980 [Aspergillus heterothallicus]
MASLTPDDYTVAWVCALPLEAAAARVMLDKTHPQLENITDQNAYDLGELNGHNIVIAYLPSGVYGKVSAAAVVSRMRSTFRHVRFALMVGIGGGVPGSGKNDIRLGDVVISKPGPKHSGVIQYDYGKAVGERVFEATGTMNKPPGILLTYMSQLEASEMTLGQGKNSLRRTIRKVLEKNPHLETKFGAPAKDEDLLFHHRYRHKVGEETCTRCDKEQLVERPKREAKGPYTHYGLIASGDRVIKDSKTRDRLAKEHGILCFEMEAAGLMDELPTLVVRGICDYCDSHKQKQWQGYAALAAAAYARLLLCVVPAYREESRVKKMSRHWMVPFSRNRRFVGRKDEIAKLEESIEIKDGPGRVAITGLGGVGKTQIALEVAYRKRERDKECSIFWIPCVSQAMVEQTLLKIAQQVGLPSTRPSEVKEQIKAYFSSDRAGRWLLILDNTDDPELWLEAGSNGGAALESFLPQSEQGRIVFTSRNRKLAMKLAPFELISIPDVDKETAFGILRNMLAQKDMVADRTTDALLEQLGFLPLAITQASAYIIVNGVSLRTYFALLQEQEHDAVQLLSEDFRDSARYQEAQNPVITTWLISFKQIKRQNPRAADYLSFMAMVNPRNIPLSLLPIRKMEKRHLDALGLLDAYSFITRQDTEINMHRLVHIATRNWLRQKGLFGHWIEKVATRLESIFPENDHKNRQRWREYLPHALPLVHEEAFVMSEDNFPGLIKAIADCLDSDGRYIEEEDLYERLVDINKRTNGRKHPTTLSSMSDLAACYLHQGRSETAEKLESRVAETSRHKLGKDHPVTLMSEVRLAQIYIDQGRYDDCANMAPEAERMKAVFGPEHLLTLWIMSLEADTAHEIFSRDRAERIEAEVLRIRKRLFGEEHPDTLKSMHRLAIFRDAQGREDEAEALATHVLSVRRRILGQNHPDTVLGMAYLAAFYRYKKQYAKAEQFSTRVVEINRSVWGPEHPNTLSSMEQLATTLKCAGKVTEALNVLKEWFHLSTEVFGPDESSSWHYSHTVNEWKGKNTSSSSLVREVRDEQERDNRLWDFLR